MDGAVDSKLPVSSGRVYCDMVRHGNVHGMLYHDIVRQGNV